METDGLNGYRFYNAGKKIDEQWLFSISPSSPGFNPGISGTDTHSLGKYPFIAPERSWFFVPSELASGTEIVRVNYPEDAKRKYGKRGIVMLDPRWDPAKEDPDKALESYPLAPTEDLVIERAETLWNLYLEAICSAHLDDVQNAMAQGNRPRAASGFTIHALKLKGYRDPAAEYLQGMREGRNNLAPQGGSSPEILGLVRSMQQQNQLMMSVMMALASGQKIDPELLKAFQSQEMPAPKPPNPSGEVPVNAGMVEVEGVPKTSLEERISRKTVEYETAATRHGGKNQRATAAERELAKT
jgi:hypothetical protein